MSTEAKAPAGTDFEPSTWTGVVRRADADAYADAFTDAGAGGLDRRDVEQAKRQAD